MKRSFMKSLTISALLLVLANCSEEGSAEELVGIQGVSDIKMMSLRTDGNYDVVCKDGTQEVRSPEQILDNDVCSSGSTTGLLCTYRGNRYYLVNSDTGVTLSSEISTLKECKSLFATSAGGLVCTYKSGWYYLVYAADGARFSSNVGTLNDCGAQARTYNQGAICTYDSSWYYMRNVQTNVNLTSNIGTLRDCDAALSQAKNGRVCAYSRPWYYVKKIATGESLSSYIGTLDECVRLL